MLGKLDISWIKMKWGIQSLIALVYSLIVFPNHFLFRTHALDLGLYTNALFYYRKFELPLEQMILNEPILFLADHFDLYLLLFSPLSFLFGNLTLLIVQVMAVLLGGEGAYRLILKLTSNNKIALAAMLYFYLFFGVITALSFDYHSNVVSIMAIPWLLLALENNRTKSFVILLVFVWIGKENVSVILGFFLLSYVFYIKNKKARNLLVGGAISSFAYFTIVTFYIIPTISGFGKYGHFEYVLGETPAEMILELIQHPINSIQLIFGEHIEGKEIVKIKMELIWFLFLSGIVFLIRRPFLIIALIPIVLMKFLHKNPFMVGIGWQYSIEFLPLLLVGVFPVLNEIKEKWRSLGIVLVLFGSFMSFKQLMEEPVALIKRENVRFLSKEHYINKDFSIAELNSFINEIPKSASISTQSAIVPHLALRDSVFLFPTEGESNYFLFNIKDGAYPITNSELIDHIEDLKLNKEWELNPKSRNGIFLFKRIASKDIY